MNYAKVRSGEDHPHVNRPKTRTSQKHLRTILQTGIRTIMDPSYPNRCRIQCLDHIWRLQYIAQRDVAALERGRARWHLVRRGAGLVKVAAYISHRWQYSRAARNASISMPKGWDTMENLWKRHRKHYRFSCAAISSCCHPYRIILHLLSQILSRSHLLSESSFRLFLCSCSSSTIYTISKSTINICP